MACCGEIAQPLNFAVVSVRTRILARRLFERATDINCLLLHYFCIHRIFASASSQQRTLRSLIVVEQRHLLVSQLRLNFYNAMSYHPRSQLCDRSLSSEFKS